MVQHRRMRKAMFLLTLFMVIATLVSGYLQSKFPSLSMWWSINNVLICLVTGCAVGYVQSAISYYTEKRNSILCFYKNIAILHVKIDQARVLCSGCHDERISYNTMIEITDFFFDAVKTTYYSIDHNSRSEPIPSCKESFIAYHEVIYEIEHLKSDLEECIKFSDREAKTMDKNSKVFMDKVRELDKVNAQADRIFRMFYSKEFAEKQNKSTKIIERYLFGKSTKDIPGGLKSLSPSDMFSPRLK